MSRAASALYIERWITFAAHLAATALFLFGTKGTRLWDGFARQPKLRAIVEPTSSGRYPALARLMDGWFHQDYDINGFEIAEVLNAYIAASTREERRCTVRDIDRFLAESSDATIGMEFENIFHPQVVIEGWDGMTMREWLTHVAQLISDSLQKHE